MIKKGDFGFDVMGLMLKMYVKPEEREWIIRQYANAGSSFIRFMIFYVGKQDWKYPKKWSAPWPMKDGKVDFKKIRKAFKDNLKSVLKLLIKYNQIPIISLFDGCHWTEHASPFQADRNINGITQIFNKKDMWLYKKTIDAVMSVIKSIDLKDYVIEIGNEPWFSNTPKAIGEWHAEVIKYLYDKYNIKPSQIQVNVTEKIGKPSINEWFQASLLCDKRHGDCDAFRIKNTGEGGVIFSYHGIGFPKHIDGEGAGARPFVNQYVSTYFQTNNNWSNDGQTVDPNDPENVNRPCAGEPLFKNRYCSPNKEELRKFYDYLLTKCKKHGLHFYTYSDLSKEIQKAKKVDGQIEYHSDWSQLDLDRISVLAEVYKQHFGKLPENYGRFPEPQPECKDGEKQYYMCPPDGGSIVTHICENGKWVETGEKCPEQPEPEPDCKCSYWLNEFKFLTWFLCLLGICSPKCK